LGALKDTMALFDFLKKKAQTQMGSAVSIVSGGRAGQAAWSDWDAKAATKEGYKASAWVYRSIALRANAVASVPFVVEKRTSDGWERVPTHPLQILLDNPNPEMGQAELMRLMVTHLDLAGNAYWLKVRDGANKPAELWPMMPPEVEAVTGTNELVSHYKLSQRTQLAAQDVVHIAYTNPDSLIYGQSPLQAAGKAVDIDNAAAAWQKISMHNRGVPDGVFTLADDVTREQFEQAKAQISEQYANQGNARGPWVVARSTWTQMSLSPAELDFIATRLNTREEIGVVFGTAEMLASLASANRASAQEVRKSFWVDTIIPLLDELNSALNLALAREYGSDIRITYDTSGVAALRADGAEMLKMVQGYWAMGVPLNTLLQHFEIGLEAVEGGDLGYLPAGVLPVGFSLEDEMAKDSETVKALAALAYGTKKG